MEFGKAPGNTVKDWTLPTGTVSDRLNVKKNRPAQLFVGCPMWANSDWLGTLYPKGTKPQDFLKVYAENFNSIEHNGSFYYLPSLEQVEKWRAVLSEGFLFSPKVPKALSHGQLDSVLIENMVEAFLKFDSFLGLPFVQFPPDFPIQSGRFFKELVSRIDGRIPLSAEFRHPSWFLNNQLHPKVFEYLKEQKVATVITDTAGRRDVLHCDISTESVMVRFLATGEKPIDRERMVHWVEKITQWAEQGVEKIYFYLHESENKISPQLAKEFIELTNQTGVFKNDLPDLSGFGAQQGFDLI